MEDKDTFEKDMDWEVPAPPEELDRVRKSIRKRNWKLIITSIVLAAVLLTGTVYGIIPAVERLYWDPYDCTTAEGVSDLNLVLSAYTELFQPGWEIGIVSGGRTGFASYDLSITRYDIAKAEYTYMTASLNKNQLGWDYRFTSERPAMNLFDRASYPFYPMQDDERELALEKLSQLPDYVTVEAAISFAEDLDMEQVLTFQDNHSIPITWVAIRNAPLDDQKFPLCGIDPFSGGAIYFEVNEKYPQFSIDTSGNLNFVYTGDILEQHFKSLLQFSSDQLEAGRGAQVYGGDRNYYTEVLEYVEENGIYSYGCVVYTTPTKLLELLENDQVSQIKLMDAWLDV